MVFIKETFAFLLQSFSIGNQCCLTFYPAPCISTCEGKILDNQSQFIAMQQFKDFVNNLLFSVSRINSAIQNIMSKARVWFYNILTSRVSLAISVERQP